MISAELCEQPFEALDLFGDNVTAPTLFSPQMMVFIENSDGLRIKCNSCMLKGATVNVSECSVMSVSTQDLMVNYLCSTITICLGT